MHFDELTKLYDRRDMLNHLKHEISRTSRIGDPFCVLMIDVDFFKDVNDNLGHLRGDRVLVEVAGILKKNCRQMDLPCRYGGDEFVLILPSTNRYEGEVMAKRILDRIGAYIFKGYDDQPDIHLTVSIGVAEYTKELEKYEMLLERADKALYLSKGKGRNSVSLDTEVLEKPDTPSLNFQSFVDRTESLDALKEKFNVVMSGTANFVVVSGEAGIGKTRLVMELKKITRLHKTIFLTSKPFEFGVTPPYHIFFELVREYMRLENTDQMEIFSRLPQTYKTILVKFLPELKLTLNTMDEMEALPPDQEKIRLYEAIYLIFEAISKKTPLLVFLDDLQWVRDADLELFGYLLRSVRQLQILFCGAYRSEETDEAHPIIRFLQTIRREHRFHPIELSGLHYNDVRELLHKILGFAVTDELNRRIFEETGGNPFYIEEIIRSMVDTGSIFWQENRWSIKDAGEISLPGTVSDLLQRRLSSVDPDLRDMLTQAAAIGPRFSLSLLKEVTGKNEGHLFDLLDAGISLLLITAERDDCFNFANILIQRTLYNGISPLRRRRMHLQIARAIENVHADKLPEYWEALARHYRIAEEWPKVFTYSLKAARKLKDLYANQDAIARLMECDELLTSGKVDQPGAEIEIQKMLGEIYFLIGEYKKSDQTVQSLLKRSDLSPMGRTECFRLQGKIDTYVGDFTGALAHFEEARKGLNEKTQAVEIAELETQLLWIYGKRGEYEKVAGLSERTLRILELAGKDLSVGFVYNILGNIAQEQGDLARAEEYHRKSLDYRKKTGALDEIARGYNNLGEVAQLRGELENAVGFYEEGLQLKRKSGERFGISYMASSIGWCLAELGKLSESRENLDEALEIAGSINSEFLLNYASVASSLLHLRLGEFEQAFEFGQKALEYSQSLGEIVRGLEARNILAQVYLLQGKSDEATKILKESLESSKQHGNRQMQAQANQIMADVHLLKGEFQEAEESCREALDIDRELSNRKLQAECLLISGLISLENGKTDQAQKELELAVNQARGINDHYLMAKAFFSMGKVKKKKGENEAARDWMNQARSLFEEMGNRFYVERIDSQLKE